MLGKPKHRLGLNPLRSAKYWEPWRVLRWAARWEHHLEAHCLVEAAAAAQHRQVRPFRLLHLARAKVTRQATYGVECYRITKIRNKNYG
jgi:hypothetical protein